jgi:ribonuclease HI
MTKLIAHTDGSSSPRQDHQMGGWGFVLQMEGVGEYITDSGYEHPTTNQRMEMLAIIKSLETSQSIDPSSTLHIVSDSRYCIDGITEWAHNWKKRYWTKSGGPIKNLDLWKRMYTLVHESDMIVTFEWVKGHAGHELNEKADQLATEAKHYGIQQIGEG